MEKTGYGPTSYWQRRNLDTGEVTSYRRGDEDDEYAGVKWWVKAKVITVYKLTTIKINQIDPDLQNPVETFEDVYTAQRKVNSEHISPSNKQQRRV